VIITADQQLLERARRIAREMGRPDTTFVIEPNSGTGAVVGLAKVALDPSLVHAPVDVVERTISQEVGHLLADHRPRNIQDPLYAFRFTVFAVALSTAGVRYMIELAKGPGAAGQVAGLWVFVAGMADAIACPAWSQAGPGASNVKPTGSPPNTVIR
jgi:hypothetical protein